MPSTGPGRGAEEAVEKTKDAARHFLQMKYPGKDISEEIIKATAPLEIKYAAFNRQGSVAKTSNLSNQKTASMLRQMRDQEPTMTQLGSGASLLVQMENLQYEATGEFKGVAFIGSSEKVLEAKFYMQREILEKFKIEVNEGENYIAVVRMVKDNPQTMFDGSKVLR